MTRVDLKTIMEIIGHKTERVAVRNQHPSPSHEPGAVEGLDNIKKPVSFQVVGINKSGRRYR
ncbi:MAG: hypothetical protein JRL30_14140 [Deltaproteobacteria bacterium]|nr:hypothetical protein [Deltaproteobacteria bacterium]